MTLSAVLKTLHHQILVHHIVECRLRTKGAAKAASQPAASQPPASPGSGDVVHAGGARVPHLDLLVNMPLRGDTTTKLRITFCPRPPSAYQPKTVERTLRLLAVCLPFASAV